MVEEIVNVYCRGQVTLVVSTPLLGLRGPSGASYPLATDIVLKILSPREQHLFMSRHHREFLWDDFKIPLVHSGLAEVRLPVKKGEGGSRAERVELVWGRLDVLKWALFICQNRDIPLVEGTNVWQGVLGRRDVRSHRDANLFGRDHDINEDITRSAAELIDSFRRAVDRADELQRALWHFGRSSVATLPRDILLEAAIGLEALLVPGPGESGYRFSLHGAVIIAGGTPRAEEIRRQLGEIYGSRSGAAHGGARAVVEGLAILARRLLAEALEQTTRLVLGGAIDVSERLPVAIQRYVFQRATR
jgi:hypothetical protein